MRNTARKGFTLLELVVVVVVIGILAGIAIPTFLNSVEKSRLASAQTTAEQVSSRPRTSPPSRPTRTESAP
jgi:prepilin-type N-terminal cleavage/methylation domain-containing protein